MVEITGEVDSREREQMQPPGVIFKKQDFRYIPILKLRIKTDSGDLIQVVYKGETPGDANIGDLVTVRGIDKGGVIHAVSIFNATTNSWVTPKARDCFIATAVYGSNLRKEIDFFLSFRDEFLARSYIGRRAIKLYYLFSPVIAPIIGKAGIIRRLIRVLVLSPTLWLIKNLFLRRLK